MSKEVIWAERKYMNIRPSNYRSGGASGIIVLCTKVKKMFTSHVTPNVCLFPRRTS